MSIQTLAQNWSEQMGYYRFLHNAQVTLGELRQSLSNHCQQQVSGRHVLAISDSSEINLSAHRGRLHPADLGVLSNDRDVGFFIHPTLVLDAADGFPLGSGMYICGVGPSSMRINTRAITGNKTLKIRNPSSGCMLLSTVTRVWRQPAK